MSRIVVFDIDGTLANVDHRRQWINSKPKNWKAWNAAMHLDQPNEDIVQLSKDFGSLGYTVLCCSGRGSDTRIVTTNWLNKHGVPFKTLYMRAAKDYRKDSIVKVELLQEIRKDYGEPWMWFDDRQQVVDAIRVEGIRVCQVAPGDF